MKKVLSILFITTFLFADKPITSKNIINLEYATQPALNSDGSRVAYVRIVSPEEGSKSRSSFREIWMVDGDGSNQRKFTSAPINSWSPQWAPNGSLTFLSYRKEHNKSTQIYSIPINGGEAYPITDYKDGIGSYKWSPNGKWIAFTSREKESAKSKKDEKRWLWYDSNG